MSEKQKVESKMMGELITRAWGDAAFKAKLLSDTMAVLKENGIAVPENVTVKAVENTDKVFHLVIPPKPSDELSDEDLRKVAGGMLLSSGVLPRKNVLDCDCGSGCSQSRDCT